jgi:hypothetical protein
MCTLMIVLHCARSLHAEDAVCALDDCSAMCTGKSHLLKLLTQFLPRKSTFFTASTGLAAVNIGGTTLHR